MKKKNLFSKWRVTFIQYITLCSYNKIVILEKYLFFINQLIKL